MKSNALKRFVYGIVSVFVLMTTVQNAALAAMISNHQLAGDIRLQEQREQVKAFVARQDVRDELVALGVEPRSATDRVDSMTPQEVAALHGRIAQLPAGEGALGTVALVLLILILLDVAGVTDIFSGV